MRARLQRINSRGFSLVELVAATIILMIGILGIVAVTRTGRNLDVTTKHRREARGLIVSEFEQQQDNYISNYNTVKLSAGTGAVTQTVTIDERGTPGNAGDDLNGMLSVTVGAEQSVTSGGITVPYLPITMSVAWPEPEGTETVQMTKWISPVQ